MNSEELSGIARQLACPQGEEGVALGAKMNELNAFVTACSIDALAPLEGERIVEIGMGNGLLSRRIAEALGNKGALIGIEKSQTMARCAQEYFEREGILNAGVHALDYGEVDLDRGSINGVLAVNVLYFIEDIRAFFDKMHTWLAGGGRLVLGLRSAQVLRNMPFTEYGFAIRSREEIIEAMEAAGFVDVSAFHYDEGKVAFADLELPMDSLILRGRKAQ